MLLLALITAWLCVAAWVYLLLGHGGFWRIASAEMVPTPSQPRGMSEVPTPAIAIVIPARNEADVIGRAIASLLRQSGCDVRIFVVDDNSSDGTGEAARSAASFKSVSVPPLRQAQGELLSASVAGELKPSDRVSVIRGAPLPPGWTGKLWAMQQGIEQALRLKPDFLLLTDADIEHAPGSIATLVNIADSGGYDLVSFMVKLHCRSLAEKLLIPAFVFFFFLLYPPEWVRDPRHRTAGAAGGCMLIRPAALERIAGIAAIRHEIIDDCALARAVKRSGGRVWLGLESNSGFEARKVKDSIASSLAMSEEHVSGHDFSRAEQARNKNSSGLQPATPETRSLRPYESFAEIERMIARTAFNQLHHSSWLLLGTVLGMLLLYVLPLALIVSGSPGPAFAGAFAYGLMTFAYLPMVRYHRVNPLWALSLPIAGVFYTAATIDSAVKYWTGRGGEWKGRAQDVG